MFSVNCEMLKVSVFRSQQFTTYYKTPFTFYNKHFTTPNFTRI